MKIAFAAILFFFSIQSKISSLLGLSCFECFECDIPPFNVTIVECPETRKYCLVRVFFYLHTVASLYIATLFIKNFLYTERKCLAHFLFNFFPYDCFSINNLRTTNFFSHYKRILKQRNTVIISNLSHFNLIVSYCI